MTQTPGPALASATAEFLRREHQLLIGGRWVPARSGRRFRVHDPATGEQIATAAQGDATDINDAVEVARAAFEGPWSKFTSAERSKVIWKLGELVDRNAEQLIEIEVLDNGLPKSLAQYVVSGIVPELLRYYAGWPTKLQGATIPASPRGKRPGEALTYTLREPIGVVGAIIPWNAPLPMAVLKIAPVLAAGCTLVLKPAELTPLSALRLGELALEAGVPAGVINIVTGPGPSAGAALASHPGVDKITFTGSTEVGRQIIQAAAGNLKKVTLELGGKSPVVVFPDADLELAIAGAARACFLLQGQNCMAGTRLFVHEKVHDRLVEGIAAVARGFTLGHGLDPRSDFGPLISEQQRARVLKYIEAGRSEGAEVFSGGHAPKRAGYFLEPTVLTRTHADMACVREEIFGPVLCVQTFADDELEKIAKSVNSTIYGLSGSVWTRDLGIAHRMVRLIDAGQVSVNCHAAIDPAIPFGGNRQSGWGREFGQEGLEPYLKTKAVTVTW